MFLFSFFNKNNELVATARATSYTEALYRSGAHPTFTYTKVATV